MILPLAFMLSQYFFGPLLFILSVFIILIVLLQRGRGGGLTGALGGAGGASAFGVKAGDIFTRITAVTVLLWIVVASVVSWWYLPLKLDIEANPGATSSVGGMSGSANGMGGSSSSDMLTPAAATPVDPATLPVMSPTTSATDPKTAPTPGNSPVSDSEKPPVVVPNTLPQIPPANENVSVPGEVPAPADPKP